MPDGVNTAVKGVQPLTLHAAPNGPAAQSESGKLPPSDHPILTLGQCHDGRIFTPLTFGTYLVLKVILVAHAA